MVISFRAAFSFPLLVLLSWPCTCTPWGDICHSEHHILGSSSSFTLGDPITYLHRTGRQHLLLPSMCSDQHYLCDTQGQATGDLSGSWWKLYSCYGQRMGGMTCCTGGVPGKDAHLGTLSLLVQNSHWGEFSSPLLIVPVSSAPPSAPKGAFTITVDIWHQLR